MSAERAPVEVARAGFVDGEAYERGRREYDGRAVAEAARALGVDRSSTVLDLAAGTGKLTRRLLALAGRVIAVEPQEQMRATLAQRTPAAEVRDGAAEAIPVPDATVDAVFVGDAFHWFDPGPALDELARVLRPGGGLGVFVRRPLTEELEWWPEVTAPTEHRRHSLLGPDRPHESEPWRDALAEDRRFEAPRRRSFDREHAMAVDDLVAYVESWSFVRSAPEDARAGILAAVSARAAAALAGQGGASLSVRWRTEVTTARLASPRA
jgi:SAM-dependent methyltransferase